MRFPFSFWKTTVTGPTLLRVGPFASNGAVAVSSLSDATLSSGTPLTVANNSRAAPLKYKNLTVALNTGVGPASGNNWCVQIWADYIDLQGTLHANATAGQFPPGLAGGAGGQGGSGGGGGDAADSSAFGTTGGSGTSGASGAAGFGSGGAGGNGTGLVYGAGYAFPNGATGSSIYTFQEDNQIYETWDYDASPEGPPEGWTPALIGVEGHYENSGPATAGGPGYGGGGNGTPEEGGNSGGGGGGAGGLVAIVTRELNIGASSRLYSIGAEGGYGGSADVSGNYTYRGGDGGQGTIWAAAKKKTGGAPSDLIANVSKIFEINHDNTLGIERAWSDTWDNT